jgi:hypothetical protein
MFRNSGNGWVSKSTDLSTFFYVFFWGERPRFFLLPLVAKCVQGPTDRIRIPLEQQTSRGRVDEALSFFDGGFQTSRFRRFSRRRWQSSTTRSPTSNGVFGIDLFLLRIEIKTLSTKIYCKINDTTVRFILTREKLKQSDLLIHIVNRCSKTRCD